MRTSGDQGYWSSSICTRTQNSKAWVALSKAHLKESPSVLISYLRKEKGVSGWFFCAGRIGREIAKAHPPNSSRASLIRRSCASWMSQKACWLSSEHRVLFSISVTTKTTSLLEPDRPKEAPKDR